MKTPKICSALVISALALPLAAWGQTSGKGTTGSQTTQPSQTQQSDYDREQKRDRQQSEQWRQQPSSTSATSATTSASASASLATGDIKRVEREEMDNRLTASDLIGKNVVGSDGEKIGTVKDIGLAGVLPKSFEQRGSAATSADDRARSSSMSASTSASGDMSASASDSSNDVIVYVAVGGVLGVGGDVVSVPASELRFDRQTEEVRLDRPSTEINAIAQAGDDDERIPAVAE